MSTTPLTDLAHSGIEASDTEAKTDWEKVLAKAVTYMTAVKEGKSRAADRALDDLRNKLGPDGKTWAARLAGPARRTREDQPEGEGTGERRPRRESGEGNGGSGSDRDASEVSSPVNQPTPEMCADVEQFRGEAFDNTALTTDEERWNYVQERMETKYPNTADAAKIQTAIDNSKRS